MSTITHSRTYILHSDKEELSFTKHDSSAIPGSITDVYINSVNIKIDTSVGANNGFYVIYFASEDTVSVSSGTLDITYEPNTDETKKYMEYESTTKMIDDDTSYSLLRVNPKLTGNIKVVVDASSNMYLDTFKVSVALSQEKYRHIRINPDEYYGRAVMTYFKSMPSDDLYKIDESCYDLFATADNLDDQYYDMYNYGVRTNRDKIYSENFSLLAPLCIRKTMPDFFLIFKIKDYESFLQVDSSNGKIETNSDRLNFIATDRCELVKCFDFREGTNLGKYIRNIFKHAKGYIGDIFTGYNYDHFNIFNGISIDKGVVSSIYEDVSQERMVTNQVAMNDWYTLGFERNNIVSKDIVNFEFMFDDTSEDLFSLPTYFGVYVKLNGENDTFSIIDSSNGSFVFDTSTDNIHGLSFNPSEGINKRMIYGVSTPYSFVRLNKNIKNSQECSKYLLKPDKCVLTTSVDTMTSDDRNAFFVSVEMKDVLDPGEHYRIIDKYKKRIYEVYASNYFSNENMTEKSYDHIIIEGFDYAIEQIGLLNTNYRSNIRDEAKTSLLTKQLDNIVNAFNKFDGINAATNGEDRFSIEIQGYYLESQLIFEKVSSICGYNQQNIDYITGNGTEQYRDNSSYMFGYENIPQMIIYPNDDATKLYYPHRFDGLGVRVCQCVHFMQILMEYNVYMVRVKADIRPIIKKYKTVLFLSSRKTYKQLTKNIRIQFLEKTIENDVTKINDSSSDSLFCVNGFGSTTNYIVGFNNEPIITNNNYLQLYQNYPLNHGVCSIFPLKDYNFNVIDHESHFFRYNENEEDQNIEISEDRGVYQSNDNIFGINLVGEYDPSEEYIADYADKFEKYFVNSDNMNHMELRNERDLGLFLYNMQSNGHDRFDISLVSPYCCKWRFLGTDHCGSMMRVMHTLHPEIVSIYFANPDKAARIDVSEYKYVHLYNCEIKEIWYYYDEANGHATKIGTSLDEEEVIKSELILIYTTDSEGYIILSKTPYMYKPYLLPSYDSYFIPEDSSNYIGFLSYNYDGDDPYPKNISSMYDEQNNGSFRDFIVNRKGSIDDLIYAYNKDNKFSKCYKYGDNTLEFVSGGVKMRINSSDVSIVNLEKYVGYSAIIIGMSGNNDHGNGTFEIFFDETKEQIAIIIYNGINSEYNSVNSQPISPSRRKLFRTKISSEINDMSVVNFSRQVDSSTVENLHVLVLKDEIGANYLNNEDQIVLITKPSVQDEFTPYQQFTIVGTFDSSLYSQMNSMPEFKDKGYIFIKDCKYTKLDRNGIQVISDLTSSNISDLDNHNKENNNTDCYVYTTSASVSRSMTLERIKNHIAEYSVFVKKYAKSDSNAVEYKAYDYSDISNLLSIDIISPVEIHREDDEYKAYTTGYVHPSYAVPLMNDIFEFNYSDSSVSDDFGKSFNGCNIYISGVNNINQTWLKKVVNIDNVMKNNPYLLSHDYTLYNSRQIDNSSDIIYKVSLSSIASVNEKYTHIKNLKDNSSLYSDSGLIIKAVSTNNLSTIYRKKCIISQYDTNLICNISYDSSIVNGYNGRNGSSVEWMSDDGVRLKWSDIVGGNIVDVSIGKNIDFYYGDFTVESEDNLNIYEGQYFYNVADIITITGITANWDNLSIDARISAFQKDGDVWRWDQSVDLYFVNYDSSNKIATLRKYDRMPYDSSGYRFKVYEEDDIIGILDASAGEKLSSDSSTSECQNDTLFRSLFFEINGLDETEEIYSNDVELYLQTYDSSINLDSNTKYELTRDDGEKKITISNSSIENDDRYWVDQSNSVTLFKNRDPMLGYWYTDMCRIFSKYDTYLSYFGVYSGYEKNNFIASRGLILKSLQDGKIKDTLSVKVWFGTIINSDNRSIRLNITNSIVNLINTSESKFPNAYGKCSELLSKLPMSIDYSQYTTKYIENTILKNIDITNKTTFTLYVDTQSEVFNFSNGIPEDLDKYEKIVNISNKLEYINNAYYMTVNGLNPHSYYAEMEIKL